MNRSEHQSRIARRKLYAALALLTDEELVVVVRKGNPEGYQVLVERYEALVRSVVAKCVRNDPMTLEDACQETFLRALARIADLREPARFKSWLCAIAHNQALDTLRRQRQISSCDISGSGGDENQPVWQIPDTKANPAEAHSRREVAGVVREVLSAMPDLYRDPITLRYEQDLDYQEIAELLGKPLGTIKSLIHRGKAIMKEELARRAGGYEGAMVLAG